MDDRASSIGQSATLTITAKVKNTGTITNTATIAGDQLIRFRQRHGQHGYIALIDVGQEDGRPPDAERRLRRDIQGRRLERGARYRQPGRDPGFPAAGLTYISDDGAGAYDHSSGLWHVGFIAADSSATLSVQAQVDSPAAGKAPTTLTNTASVKSVQEPESSS